MALKLTAAESKEQDKLKEQLTDESAALFDAITQYNNVTKAAREELADVLATYNGVLADAKAFIQNVAERCRGEYDEKSERWQEGDKGEAAASWIETWENVDLPDEVDLELPDELGTDAIYNEEIFDPLTESPED